MWNPGLPTVLATATVTGEIAVWELKGDSITKINSKPTFGASCLSWSSKVTICTFYFYHIIFDVRVVGTGKV